MHHLLKALIASTFLMTSLPLLAEQAVRLGVGEWPPYVSLELEDNGSMSKLVIEAFSESGIETELHWLPWPRALRSTAKAELDATFPWYRSKEREQQFLFSDPLAYESTSIFHHKDLKFSWDSLEDLKPYHIGANTDFFYSEAFALAEQDNSLNITRVDTELQLIEMVLRNRLDIILMNKAPGRAFIHQAQATDMIVEYPKVFSQRQMHVIFAKSNPLSPQRLKAFNEGLRKSKAKQAKLTVAH